MGLGKSFGISFVIYIALNFIMNMLFVLANAADLAAWFGNITSDTFNFLAGLFTVGVFMPSGFQIGIGVSQGISLFGAGDIFLGIMYIIGPILPGLIAAIVAGRMAINSKQAFVGWLLTALVSSIILLVFNIIEPTLNIYVYIAFLYGAVTNVDFIVHSLLVGLFIGLLWGSIAAIMGSED